MMSKSIIVWVFGSSAAGKETFLRKLQSGFIPVKFKELGWDKYSIKVVEESITLVPQSETDSAIVKRNNLVDIIAQESQNLNQVIFTKGQDWDLIDGINRPNEVYTRTESNEHYVLFLNAPLQVLYERCLRKPWWDKDDGIDVVKEWLIFQLNLLKSIKDHKVFSLSSENSDYSEIHYPPEVIL